jgi:hypothetical protein
MNGEIGTETPIFLFWEYLFRNFGIFSLQCSLSLQQMKVTFACDKCSKKCLKVSKCEIFHLFDFNDFYGIKSL